MAMAIKLAIKKAKVIFNLNRQISDPEIMWYRMQGWVVYGSYLIKGDARINIVTGRCFQVFEVTK